MKKRKSYAITLGLTRYSGGKDKVRISGPKMAVDHVCALFKIGLAMHEAAMAEPKVELASAEDLEKIKEKIH